MTSPANDRQQKWTAQLKKVLQAFGGNAAKCCYVFLAGALLMCLLVCLAVTPKRYRLNVGDISYTAITASKDVVDEIETAAKRDQAAQLVEPTYLFKEEVAGQVIKDLNDVLAELCMVQRYGSGLIAASNGTSAAYSFSEAELKHAKSMLTTITLQDYQVRTLLRTGDEQMDEMCRNVTTAVENVLNSTIREGHVSETVQYLQQIIGYKTSMDLLQNVVTPLLRKVVQPNMLIDQEATEKLRDEARAAVEPVVYKQGQNIVPAHERVTVNQLEMLRSLGLLDDDTVDINTYIGGCLLVLMALGVLAVTLRMLNFEALRTPKTMLIIMIVLISTFGFCILCKKINVYLMPTLLASMLATFLLGYGVGVSTLLSMCLLVCSLILGGDTGYGTEAVILLFTTFISGFVTTAVIKHKTYRQQVLLCGLISAVINAVIVLAVAFMTNASFSKVYIDMLWSAGSAGIAALLCMAMTALMEVIFNLATPAKLMELCDPNHPLMRRLLMEAPGTYHHSIIVANLAEAAAEAIGARTMLARAGAYYHDIGKLKRPQYFRENQMGENPHEHTNPYISAAIVTAHARDGIALAQQYHLPKEVQAVIAEHHGDTPVVFFYHKAVEQAGGNPVDMTDFRYNGTRPQSRESAIVMMADTVEAAVRSMHEPTPEKIRQYIQKLVYGKIDDMQLSESPISLREVTAVCDAFCTVLNGVFHERIEYPDISPTAAAMIAEQNAKQQSLQSAEAPKEEESKHED